jgi:hypothetical protein
LEGLVPICSFLDCRKIRDEDGKWVRLESFLVERSEIEFSHGLCPDCVKKHYSDLDEKD